MEFNHIPIMLDEVINGLNVRENKIYVDGTLGGAGHSIEIAKKIGKNGLLIGIDQDLDALNKAKKVLEKHKTNCLFIHNNFRNTKSILKDNNIEKVDGILLDIGVSSHQLDEGDRGFSYNYDAPLDMRMDQEQKFSAWDVINKYKAEEIEKILLDYGEERWARRIAQFIVEERKNETIDTTFQLLSIIKKAIPKEVRRDGGNPGRKTFQAIRIEVNSELEVLENSIEDMVDVLNPKGRLAIITFHSLEDRIVKNKFRELYTACTCPPNIPQCVCGGKRRVNIITRKPLIASDKELKENNRSRSAKLRIIEKI